MILRDTTVLLAGLIGLGLIGLAPVGSWAQSAPEDEQEPSKPSAPPAFAESIDVEADTKPLPTLNLSATRLPVPLLKTPASVAVVSQAVIEDQHAVVLGDALRNVSGVNVATGFGVFDFFVVRGFDSLSNGLVLTDAAPEPEASFYPLYNLSRVEVLKGPNAFLYGANTLSGAVNLLRKQPIAQHNFADASVSYGHFDTLDSRVDANVSSSDGRVAARVGGIFRNSDAYRDEKRNRLYAVNPSLLWAPGRETRLTFNLEYQRSEFMPDSGIPVLPGGLPPVPRTRSYQSPFDSSEQDLLRFRFDFEQRLSETVTLRNKLYYTDLEWASDGTLVLGVLPNAGGGLSVSRVMALLDDRQKLLGNQLEALFRFQTGSVQHDLLLGVELQRYTDVFQQDIGFLPPIDLLDPVETAPGVFPIPGLTTRGDSRTQTLAPYVVDRIGLSSRFELFVGGRLDSLDFEDDVTSTDRDETQFNPMGGLVFAVTPTLSFYASAASAFGPPSTQVVGERAPEESVQFEGGIKARVLDDRGFVSLAVYQLDKDNIAIPDQGVLKQLGDQRARGVELELAVAPAEGWYASLAYALNDAVLTRFTDTVQVALNPPAFVEVDYSGNAPAFAPRHILNAWGTRHFGGGLVVGGGVRYVSSQFIGEDNTLSIDDYWTADAILGYERGRVRASVNFSNLTNTSFETRGFPGSAVIPANPFAIYARLRIGFGAH